MSLTKGQLVYSIRYKEVCKVVAFAKSDCVYVAGAHDLIPHWLETQSNLLVIENMDWLEKLMCGVE